MQGFREEPKPAKKYPTPRIELGETPEGFVKRLVEGEGEDGDGKIAKGDVSRVLSARCAPDSRLLQAALLLTDPSFLQRHPFLRTSSRSLLAMFPVRVAPPRYRTSPLPLFLEPPARNATDRPGHGSVRAEMVRV